MWQRLWRALAMCCTGRDHARKRCAVLKDASDSHFFLSTDGRNDKQAKQSSPILEAREWIEAHEWDQEEWNKAKGVDFR